MCNHDSPQEARRCSCTGYGFGDPPCRCGHPKSQHLCGTGACVIASARCHEFVLHFKDTFPVTVSLVRTAADAVMTETGLDPSTAMSAAMAALFAGRKHAMERDRELETVRAANDRLRKQLKAAERRFTPDDR